MKWRKRKREPAWIPPAPSSGRGEVLIGGHRFPVQDVRLRNGEVKVIFAVNGPLDPFEGMITVFGEDGQGCWQGTMISYPNGVPAGHRWVNYYGMRINEVHGTETGKVMKIT